MLSLIKELVPVPVRSRVPFTQRSKNERAWRQFASKYRYPEQQMLTGLGKLRDSILVAGCQRSGGTMLTDLICRHAGIVDYCKEGDRELEGARLLAGNKTIKPNSISGRWCFQTTYLNEHYGEYLHEYDFRLVWLIRKPEAVIRSMLCNWNQFALHELFQGCLVQRAALCPEFDIHASQLNMACFAYLAKNAQIIELAALLRERVLVLDYDKLVTNREIALAQLHQFLELDYTPQTGRPIRNDSLSKSEDLSAEVRSAIQARCSRSYQQVRELVTVCPDWT